MSKKKLTIKESLAVRELLVTGNQGQAIENAGYKVKDRRTAQTKAVAIFKRQHVQSELARLIDEKYPDLDRHVAKIVNDVILAVVKGSPEDDGSSFAVDLAEKRKWIELLGKVKGHAAPNKTLNVSAKIAKLPQG